MPYRLTAHAESRIDQILPEEAILSRGLQCSTVSTETTDIVLRSYRQ